MARNRTSRTVAAAICILVASGCQAVVGQRTLGGDWTPVENQATIGLSVMLKPRAYGLRPEFGVLYSADRVSSPEIEGSLTEVFAGVRKSFGEEADEKVSAANAMRAYWGAGISVIHGELDQTGLPELDGETVGVYAHVGVQIAPMVAIDFRYVAGTDLDFTGAGHDADGMMIAVLIGPPTILEEFGTDDE